MKTFYWYFRPVAIMAKIFAVFPLQNIHKSDPSELKHCYWSFSFLYCCIAYVFYLYMQFYFSGFMWNVDAPIFSRVVVYLIHLRAVICFYFCTSYSKHLPKLICMLDNFDKKKKHVLVRRIKRDSMNFLFWTIFPLIWGAIVIGFFIYNYSTLIRGLFPPTRQDTDGFISSVCFGLLSFWQIIPVLSYIYFGWKVRCDFVDINFTLKEKGYVRCFFDDDIVYDGDMAKTLESIRLMHNMLTECVRELSRIYGGFMALDNVCLIVVFVVNIVAFIYSMSHDVHLLLLTAGDALILIQTIQVTEEIKAHGTEIIRLLNGIQLSKISKECGAEIKMIMVQLSLCPIEVSAAGFFTIDRKQLTSIVSAVATYLIVFIQYVQEETKTSCCGNSSFPII